MASKGGAITYYLLSLFAGSIISVMIFLNGKLTAGYGAYLAAVIIHVVGAAFAGTICFAKREKWKSQAPLWAYMGGAVGVLTTLFNNYAFGQIDMTSIVALGLLGQSLSSVALDTFGWLGIKQRRQSKYSAIGYLAAVVGIFVMLDQPASGALFAVLLSICAGVTVVLSRTINARLSSETSPIVGSLINHLVGLPICVVLALLFSSSMTTSLPESGLFLYFGGVLGVATVLLFNITVPKISAFQLTLLSFIGQVFMGIFLDLVFGAKFSTSTFAGALILSAGLLINLLLEQRANYRKRRKQQYWDSIHKAQEAHWDRVLKRK